MSASRNAAGGGAPGAPTAASDTDWVAAQAKVFSKWIKHVITAYEPGAEIQISGANLVAELKDGRTLARLLRALTRKPLPFAIDRSNAPFAVLNRLEMLLNYAKTLNVPHTTSPSDVYNSNVVQVLGLVWLIIYKYQNINRAELLQWLTDRLKSYSAKLGGLVKDFTSAWQSGLALCALIHSMSDDNLINMDDVMSLGPEERVQLALTKAESALGIPALLEAADVINAPVESVMMTYLSSVRNKSAHGSIVKDRDEVAPPVKAAAPKKAPAFTRTTTGIFHPSSNPSDEVHTMKRPPSGPITAAHSSTSADDSHLKEQLASLKAKVEQLEKVELEAKVHHIRELEETVSRKEADLAQAKLEAASETATLKETCRKQEKSLHELKQKLEEFEALKALELAALQTEISAQQNEIAMLKSSSSAEVDTIEVVKHEKILADSLEEQRQSIHRSDVEPLERQLKELEKRLQEERHSKEELTKELHTRLEEQDKSLQAALSAKDARIAELEAGDAKNKKNMMKITDELDRVSNELKQLRAAHAEQAAAASAAAASSPESKKDKQKQKEKDKEKEVEKEKEKKKKKKRSKGHEEAAAPAPDTSDLEGQLKAALQKAGDAAQEVERLRTETKRAQQTIIVQTDEIQMLKTKNSSLVSRMKEELKALLQKQQDDSNLIDLLKHKVSAYSSELIELQTLVREKGLTDVTKLEQELAKMSLRNEELQKQIARLEKDMLDAQRRAEALRDDLEKASLDGSDGSSGNAPAGLKDQLEASRTKIQELLEWRKAAMSEINRVKVDNDDLHQLLKILDQKVKTASKAPAAAAPAPQESNADFVKTYESTYSDVSLTLEDLKSWTTGRFEGLQKRLDTLGSS